MIGPDGYGDADDVIGISLELLAQATGLCVDGDGLLWLAAVIRRLDDGRLEVVEAGDSRYRYRPVRFASTVHGLSEEQAIEGARMLVCERLHYIADLEQR